MKKYLPYIVIAALALGVWLYLNRGKCKLCKLFQDKSEPEKTQEETPLDPAGEGFRMGGGGAGGFLPEGSSVTNWIAKPQVLLVQPRLTYNEIRQRRIAGVKQFGNAQFKPKPGTNVVTTPSGNTATIGVNPNKPTFT